MYLDYTDNNFILNLFLFDFLLCLTSGYVILSVTLILGNLFGSIYVVI